MEQHFTADEIASKLKLHVSTVFRAAAAGELRSVVIGRARRFPESAVTEWLNRRAGTANLDADNVVELGRR